MTNPIATVFAFACAAAFVVAGLWAFCALLFAVDELALGLIGLWLLLAVAALVAVSDGWPR